MAKHDEEQESVLDSSFPIDNVLANVIIIEEVDHQSGISPWFGALPVEVV